MRALVKHLDEINDHDIVNVNIPTGIALVYELDDDLHPLRHEFLGHPEHVRKAMEAVDSQGKVSRAG